MECFKCHHINEPYAKFCSNCGKNFHSKNTKSKAENTVIYPNNEAVTMHEAKLKEKAYNSIAVIVIFSIILALMCLLAGNILGVLIGTAFIGIFFLTFLLAKKSVTEQYYYTLPASKDSEGNHRCIFCGNKGIYKSTIYQTNTVVNACSKCQKPLFRN